MSSLANREQSLNGRPGSPGYIGNVNSRSDRLSSWEHLIKVSLESVLHRTLTGPYVDRPGSGPVGARPRGARQSGTRELDPSSALDEQRVIVEPDRPTASGDARGVSRRDVDDEDGVIRGGTTLVAHDPAPVGGPGSRGDRVVTGGNRSPSGAVGVGHPPLHIPAGRDLGALERHQRTVGRQRAVP